MQSKLQSLRLEDFIKPWSLGKTLARHVGGACDNEPFPPTVLVTRGSSSGAGWGRGC